jgi:hypothetical protein
VIQFEEKRRYFLDTEFIDNGHAEPIHLVSLALVCDDGREYYAEIADALSYVQATGSGRT